MSTPVSCSSIEERPCPTNVLSVDKSDVAKAFNKAARNYQKNAVIQAQIAKKALDLAQKVFVKEFSEQTDTRCEHQSRLLDLGCASGVNAKKLTPPNGQYIGLDLSQAMLQEADKYLSKSNCDYIWVNADAEHLPFANESFDCIFSSMALQWSGSCTNALAEIYRTLKPNGKGMLAIMVDGSFSTLNKAWKTMGVNRCTNAFFTGEQWLKGAEAIGFSTESNIVDFNQHFDTSLELLKSIKTVGAGAQHATNKRLPMSKQELKQLEWVMRAQSDFNRLQLNYKVLFLTIFKN